MHRYKDVKFALLVVCLLQRVVFICEHLSKSTLVRTQIFIGDTID